MTANDLAGDVARGRWPLDPEIARLMADETVLPPVVLTLENLSSRRAQVLAEARAFTPSGRVTRTDHQVPGPAGAPDVVVRVHTPEGMGVVDGGRPAVLAIHGGGYVMGSYLIEDARLERWCSRLGVVGIAVDYRLAPETPYPGPLEDCYAGLRWLCRHADALGVDADRIGLCGSSAGGGLAAALALLARDRGEIRPACQLLIFPMLDDRRQTPSSGWDVPVWPPAANELGWRCYLGARYGSEDVPPTAAPARAGDLAGLPPSFVCVGTVDGFHDEDVAYAQRLVHHGVPAELHVYSGAPHGFLGTFPTAALARRCQAEMDGWLAARLGVTTS